MLQSVKTALRVFELVAQKQPIGVSEIARQMDVTKSTVQRCLLTLRDAGWLRPESEDSAKWVITARPLSLGGAVSDGFNLTRAALPAMHRLRDVTQETIHLAVADGRDSVLLERLESPQPVRIFYPVGNRVPLNASATGKAMLAQRSRESIEHFLAEGLQGVTSATITSREIFLEELRTVHRQGWAAAIDELGEGASAVAAAILGPNRQAVAAISVSGPTVRFSETLRIRYAALAMEAAKETSERLFGST